MDKFKKLQLGKTYEVKWLDSISFDGAWRRVQQINWTTVDKDMFLRTMGYLIKETDAYIALAQSRREYDELYVGLTLIVPKVSILEIKKL